MSEKSFREQLELAHDDLWQNTVNRLDLREEDPEGSLLVNVMSYEDGYVTTVAQHKVDPSDLVNIGVELMTEGVLQLCAKLEQAQENTDDEELKELTPIDVAEAGIEKACDQLRSRVRRIMTNMLSGKQDEDRKREVVKVTAEELGEGDPMAPADGPVQ